MAVEMAAAVARKVTRNPEASRARILAAAREEFVSYGLSGARVDRIASQSGVNKNLIYHYFGSKDALYLAVLEGIYAGLRERQRDEDLRELPPVEGIRRLVESTFDHFVATPELIRLMSVENIHFGEYLKRSRSIKPLYSGLLDTIEILLNDGLGTLSLWLRAERRSASSSLGLILVVRPRFLHQSLNGRRLPCDGSMSVVG